jgi:hypothetical protein
MSWFKRMTSSEHRKAQRLKSPLLVAYYWDGSIPSSHPIQNISSTGFYLLTRERWHPGTIVTMTLQRTSKTHVNSTTDHHISVMSKVIRLGEDGVGFAFMPFDAHEGLQSRPVGKREIGKFLEQLKSDRGYAVMQYLESVLKTKLLRQDLGSSIVGDPWRKPYEEPEG